MRGWATAVATRSPPVPAGRPRWSTSSTSQPAADRAAAAPRPAPWPGNRKPIRGAAGVAEEDAAVGVEHGPARRCPAASSSLPSWLLGVARGCEAPPPPGTAGRPARPCRVAARSPSSAKDSRVGMSRPARRSCHAARRCCRRRSAAARRPARSATSARDLGGDRGPARAARRCSSTTWVLMPPKPIEDTPARIGPLAGHSSAVRGTRSAGVVAGSSFGCGSTWPVAGGITWWWMARMALIRPADPGRRLGVPDVALDRADRGRRGASGSAAARAVGEGAAARWRHRPRCRCRGPRSSRRSRCRTRRCVGPVEGEPVAGGLGPGDAALAVGGDAPAGDGGVDA